MKKISLWALIGAFSFTLACTGAKVTSTTSTKNQASTSIYPSWYNNDGFATDSTSFLAVSEGVSTDSTMALTRANSQAKVRLESNIAKELEAVRKALVKNGSSTADTKGFIVALRNAHYRVQDEATISNSIALKKGTSYVAFAEAQISKSEVHDILKNSIGKNARYWRVLMNDSSFNELLGM